MNKVTSINLNGNAFQVEETGYARLQEYLHTAAEHLANDPDKNEITQDIEQSIADKFQRFLTPHKTVVTDSEVEQIVAEMGPVKTQADGEKSDNTGESKEKDQSNPKRLYRVKENSMLAGVCSGLAAYFNVDVVLIRLAFVLLAVFSHGFGILAYIVMMLVVPSAKTPAQKSAAFGAPFNAQDLINRVKNEYSRWDRKIWKQQKREWKQQWRAHARAERDYWRQNYEKHHQYNQHGRIAPLRGALYAIFGIVWILAFISLIKTSAIFGWAISAAIPFWAAIVILILLYFVAVSLAESLFWFLIIGVILYFLYHHIPQAHAVMNSMWTTAQSLYHR
ncbi:MAG TPA: PspC domain-containing protein [Candidatus Paceibacterota bacterium]|nr:PspC domain-containing protein [Candidatus Paceibacterota bacterium]